MVCSRRMNFPSKFDLHMTVFFHEYNIICRHLYYNTLMVYRRLLFCSTRCLQSPTKCVLYYHTITVAEKTYRYNECQRVYIIRFANDFMRSIKIIAIFDNIHAVEYYYYYNRIIIRDCSLSPDAPANGNRRRIENKFDVLFSSASSFEF